VISLQQSAIGFWLIAGRVVEVKRVLAAWVCRISGPRSDLAVSSRLTAGKA
jgi:hypothetical protein